MPDQPTDGAPVSGEENIKHLEWIQAIIARQAANSFLLKGWSLTLVAALFALAAQGSNTRFVAVALLPILSFCGLDCYYLHQEKRFRALFNCVRRGPSLEQREKLGRFGLDPGDLIQGAPMFWSRSCPLLSPPVWLFYSSLLIAVALVYVLGAR